MCQKSLGKFRVYGVQSNIKELMFKVVPQPFMTFCESTLRLTRARRRKVLSESWLYPSPVNYQPCTDICNLLLLIDNSFLSVFFKYRS